MGAGWGGELLSLLNGTVDVLNGTTGHLLTQLVTSSRSTWHNQAKKNTVVSNVEHLSLFIALCMLNHAQSPIDSRIRSDHTKWLLSCVDSC